MIPGECETCMFWEDDEKECRFSAPVLKRPDKNDTPNRQWPKTAPDDWCGDYRPYPYVEENPETFLHN